MTRRIASNKWESVENDPGAEAKLSILWEGSRQRDFVTVPFGRSRRRDFLHAVFDGSDLWNLFAELTDDLVNQLDELLSAGEPTRERRVEQGAANASAVPVPRT